MNLADTLSRWERLAADLQEARANFRQEFQAYGYVTEATKQHLNEQLALNEAALLIDDIREMSMYPSLYFQEKK